MSIEQLIEDYGANKAQLDHYKKLCDEGNKAIKSYMRENGLKQGFSDTYKVNVSVSETNSLNEAKLLDVAHSTDGLSEIIKTKEYIDFDALENLIYQGKLSQEALAEINSCRTVKQIETLRITRRKDVK